MPLRWSKDHPTGNNRKNILRAVANACLDLLRINTPGESALNWIESKIRRKIARAEAGTLPRGSVPECERQLALVRDYWIPDLDNSPHILIHGDLSSNNIIVDEKHGAVRSIIDLGWAELVPLQFAAVYPRFLTHEPDKLRDFKMDGSEAEQMRLDRDFYLNCIKFRAFEEGSGLLQDYYRTLTRADEVSRYWWMTAASRIDIHHAMAKCDWKPNV